MPADQSRRRLVAADWVGPLVMTAGGVVALIASFAPWVRSGTKWRSSYETLGIVERLGFVPGGVAQTVIRLWPLMPVLVTAAVVTAWWGWRWQAIVFGVAGGLYAATLGFIVATATPDSRQVGVSLAPAITAIAALVLIAGSLWMGLGRIRSAP